VVLSAKRRVFIEEYIRCGWNATEAARRAGYRYPRQQGQRLLTFVDIQTAINARIAERAMGADEVLDRLAEHARGSMADFLDIRNNWVTLDIDRAKQAGVLHLIKKFRQTREGTEVQLYDAQGALELLGKHLGLFKDTIDLRSVDLTRLTDEQLERIANGEDPASVLAATRQSGAGEAPPAEPSGESPAV